MIIEKGLSRVKKELLRRKSFKKELKYLSPLKNSLYEESDCISKPSTKCNFRRLTNLTVLLVR
jgi:hypothetical protein